MAQLVAHLVRDQEVAGSSPVIQTTGNEALTETRVPQIFVLVALLTAFLGDAVKMNGSLVIPARVEIPHCPDAYLNIASRSYAFVTSICRPRIMESFLESIGTSEYFTVPQHPQEVIDIDELNVSRRPCDRVK